MLCRRTFVASAVVTTFAIGSISLSAPLGIYSVGKCGRRAIRPNRMRRHALFGEANDQGQGGGGPGVACEHGPGFPQAPMASSGLHLDPAVVHASGAFNWDDGNIGGGGEPQNDLVLNYGHTYYIQAWTVSPNSDGTRFTYDAHRSAAALRRAGRERGAPLPSIEVADALLDERRELPWVRLRRSGSQQPPLTGHALELVSAALLELES
jgi:hypothetical protein